MKASSPAECHHGAAQRKNWKERTTPGNEEALVSEPRSNFPPEWSLSSSKKPLVGQLKRRRLIWVNERNQIYKSAIFSINANWYCVESGPAKNGMISVTFLVGCANGTPPRR